MRSTIIGLWFSPDKTWMLICKRSVVSANVPRNLQSLLTTSMCENPDCNQIFIKANAKAASFWLWGRFVYYKRCHATWSNQVVLGSTKVELSTSWITNDKKNLHWCINRKTIDQVYTKVLGYMGQWTPRVSLTKAFTILVYTRPEITLVNAVERAEAIKVHAGGVSMERHKDNVA